MRKTPNNDNKVACIILFVIFAIIWAAGYFDASEMYRRGGICIAFMKAPIVQYIVNAFPLVWSLSITIILFLIEFDRVYWYGVTLKDIIKLSFWKGTLIWGVITHFALCPLMFLSLNWGFRRTWLATVVITYFIFCLVPLYIFYILSKKRIISFAAKATICKIGEQIATDVGESQGSLQEKIEELPITDMIKHIDYGNIEDTIVLRKAMKHMYLDEKEKGSLPLFFHKKNVGKVLYTVWSDRIMRYYGLSTSARKEQMVYVLRKLWEDATEEFENIDKDNKAIKEEMRIVYSVEILLPCLKQNTEEAAQVFSGLWSAMLELQKKILLYLCLYMDYLYYACEASEYKLDDVIFEQISKCEITEAIVYWNKQIALDFWESWCMLPEVGNNMAASYRKDFFKDVESIRNEKFFDVKSNNLKRLFWKR